MDTISLRQVQALLQQRKTELLAKIARCDQQARMSPDKGTDAADMAVDTLDREMLFSQAGASRRALRAIVEALNRIEEGTFGECERCGGEITIARLKAIPWARYCVGCQEKLEGKLSRAA